MFVWEGGGPVTNRTPGFMFKMNRVVIHYYADAQTTKVGVRI